MCYEPLITKIYHRRLLLSILGWALTLAIRSQLSMYVTNASFSYTFLLQKIIFMESKHKVLAQSLSRWDPWFLNRFHARKKKRHFQCEIQRKEVLNICGAKDCSLHHWAPLLFQNVQWCLQLQAGLRRPQGQKEHSVSSLLYACSPGILLFFNFCIIILI